MKKSLGKLRAGAIGMMELPALPPDIRDGYRALPDLTGMSSDAMDELGIVGVVPAALLRPTDPKARGLLAARSRYAMSLRTRR